MPPFEEFMSAERHDDLADEAADEIQQDIDTILRLLEGRKRENTQAEFEEAKKDLLRLLPSNDTLKAQIKRWDDKYREMKYTPDVRLKPRPVTRVVGGGRSSHASQERDENTEKLRREREQQNVNTRSRAREEALNKRRKTRPSASAIVQRKMPGGVKEPSEPEEFVMHSGRAKRDTSANYPIDLEQFKIKSPEKHAQMNASYGRIANNYNQLWKNHRVASQPLTFYKDVRNAMFPKDQQSPAMDFKRAVSSAGRKMKTKEAINIGQEMGYDKKWGKNLYISKHQKGVQKAWNQWLEANRGSLDPTKNYRMLAMNV